MGETQSSAANIDYWDFGDFRLAQGDVAVIPTT
jgi:hypothetical protein